MSHGIPNSPSSSSSPPLPPGLGLLSNHRIMSKSVSISRKSRWPVLPPPPSPVLSSSYKDESPLCSSSAPNLIGRFLPTRPVLKSNIGPAGSSSMSNIEDEVSFIQQQEQSKKIEEEVRKIQREHSTEIIQRRASFSKKPPKGEIEITPLLVNLPNVIHDITESLPKLIPRTNQSPGKSMHVKKNSISDNKTGYGLTMTAAGKTYVHFPKGTIACGGESEIKLAVDILTKQLVVVSKRESTIYGSRSGPYKQEDLLAGEKKIMERCIGCKYLAVPFVCTTRDRVIDGMPKRYFYTITKYYKDGNISGKVFQGAQLIALAIGLAKGLQRMHLEGLAHRDIKPENMYLDDGVPVTGDFGTVVSIEDVDKSSEKTIMRFTRHSPGTPAYKPPESVDSLHHINPENDGPIERFSYIDEKFKQFERLHPLEFVKKGDIFSLGITLFELSRQICKEGATRRERHLTLVEASRSFRRMQHFEKGFDKLLSKMVNGNPKKRPSIDVVIAKLKKLR